MSCQKLSDNSFTLYNVTFDNLGNEKHGYCGIVMYGQVYKGAPYETYKINNLNDSVLKNTANGYTAKITIIPNKNCHCMDETVDPMPGHPFPSYDLKYIQIVEIKKN